MLRVLFIVFFVIISSCSKNEIPPRLDWAIAIHGGAGVISKTLPDSIKQGYERSLEKALSEGVRLLKSGKDAMEVVEKVAMILEEDPRFNAGRGAVFTAKGTHELDAAIMDGSDLSAGAVTGLTTVKHPISLARMVKDSTSHILLMGHGAEVFADEMGVERVDNSYFSTQRRKSQWERSNLKDASYLPSSAESFDDKKMGTIGVAALDTEGNVAAATSTGGMTNKKFGRVGDVPIIGAGTYANNATAAISATGKGEEFIRHGVARSISALMEFNGWSLQKASHFVIHSVLQPGDGGIIAVDAQGNVVLEFNSQGMFRGKANSLGMFEVAIWE